jgi:phosphomannomutase
VQQATENVKERFLSTEVEIDYLDGLTVIGDSWWFNLRPSNTEPLLRLNVEAKDQAQMQSIRDQVLALIRN